MTEVNYRQIKMADFPTEALLFGRSRCSTPFYLEHDPETNQPGEAYAMGSTPALGNLHTTVCNYFGGGAPFCFRWKSSNINDFTAFSEENKAYHDGLLAYLREGDAGDMVWVRDNSDGMTAEVDGTIPEFHAPRNTTNITAAMSPAQLALYAWDFAKINDHAAFLFAAGDQVFRVAAVNVAESKILLWDLTDGGDFRYCDLTDRIAEDSSTDFLAIFAEYLEKYRITEDVNVTPVLDIKFSLKMKSSTESA